MTTGRINQVAIPLSTPHARERRGADLGPTQGRERVLTRCWCGPGQEGAKRGNTRRRRFKPSDGSPATHHQSSTSTALAVGRASPTVPTRIPHASIPRRVLLLFPRFPTRMYSSSREPFAVQRPAAAGPRRPIRQQGTECESNRDVRAELNSRGRATKAHQAAVAPRTRIDSGRDSITS